MRIIHIVSSLILTTASIFYLFIHGVSWTSIGCLIFTGGASILFIFEKQWEKLRKKKIKDADCLIKENCFYFPKGYYFKYGFLKSQKELPFNKITEIRTNTLPATAVINGSEIIFLRGLNDEDLNKLKQTKLMKVSNPTDNWALICEEFFRHRIQ